MTTPEFIAWLDGKMAAYGKLIPPPEVLAQELDARLESKTRTAITELILREAGLDRQVAAALRAIKRPSAATLARGIKALFARSPDREWRDHVESVAAERTKKV
jgi:hypothetical protein